jgi:hypothetical protein
LNSSVDVGAVIRRTFDIYVDQAAVLMPAAAVVVGVAVILDFLLVAAAPGLAFIATIISLVATTLFTGMVVELVADVREGRRDANIGQLLRTVTPVLGNLILVAIAAGVGILIGLVLLVIPGLYLATMWAVAAPVVVLERPGGLRALGRSRELVKGNGWNVFAVILLLVLLVGLFAGLIGFAAESAGTGVGLVVRVVVGVLTAPISALAAAVLYFELGGSRGAGPTVAPVSPPDTL